MRKYIIIALVLLAGGVTASIYLIPSDSEVAALQARDVQTIDMGKVDVEAEYAQGRRTFPIISALADKRIAAGDRPAAVKLLEEYVAANAADINGRKKLAEQYQLSGNQEGFNAQIEAIATAAPTEANLRTLSDIYNASKEYAKQVEVLKKILTVTNGAQPQIYVDLATMQVVVGDSDGALATVEALKAKHPQFSSYPMTRIMVSVLAEKGKGEEALAAAKGWMETPNAPVPTASVPASPSPAAPLAAAAGADNKPKYLADLCNILHYSGHADKAVALTEPYRALFAREPELVLAYVNASITAGQSEQAYAILKEMDDAGQMVAALYPPYLNLTLKRDDTTAAEAIIAKLDPASFTEEQALVLIEVARAQSAPTLLTALAGRFSDPAVTAEKPVLAAVIAIVTNDKTADAKIEVALNATLTSTQRVHLAESCARGGKTPCFDAIVKQYPPLTQMSPAQVAEYAQIFIIATRAAEQVDAVGELALKEHPAMDVVMAHRRLAAASGRADVLSPWLQANANSAPIAQLQQLFYLANDHKHAELASDIAERLYARDPSPMNRDILVNAYIGSSAYAKAAPLLREQIKAGGEDGLYLSALSKLARNDAEARKELTDYAQAALGSGQGDARAKLNYAYILINHGRKDVVLPYAKSYAATGDANWKKLYAQLSQKPKATGGTAAPTKLSREQLVAMAQNPQISRENKREVAFSLLNAGHKAEALTVFEDLAKDAGPDSQEVKDLLYLWGGKLNAPQLAWVMKRAASANAYDRQQWGNLVNNAGDDTSVISYVGATPDALYNSALRTRYFNVLAATGNRNNYENAMRSWVEKTTDVPALLDYATIAQNSGFRAAAANGFERVLTLDPANSKALSAMAALDFSKGKFRSADQKLTSYLSAEQQTPDPTTDRAQAYFYKAQLLRRDGKEAEAKAAFSSVLEAAAQSGTKTPDALSRVYTSQFHLGQHAQAKAGFEQLLEQYPENKGLLADYMSILIEYKYLDDATRIANQYDKTSPYYRKGAALIGTSAHTSAIKQLSNGREMKISFSQPIGAKPPVDMAAVRQLPWVAHSELGYDSLSISAKPGYVVRYMPTANDQFAVVASPSPNYAPQVELQRQQDLRLQLLYARIEQDSGQADKAAQRIDALKHYYPEDPQLLSYEASVASAQGKPSRARELIAKAQAIAPENEDFTLQAQNISRVGRGQSFAKLDHEYRALGDNQEHITTASGAVRAGSLEFGLTAQNDALETDNIRRARDGAISDYDADRQRGEAYLAYYLDNGDRALASLFANNATVGGGANYAFDNPLGRTEVLGEYQRPYWDFVEAVYEDATRDRVGVKHFATLRPTTTLGLEASYNNYNIDLADDVAQTALVRLNLVEQLQPQTQTQPYLGVGYGFDGEYMTDGKPDTRIDGSGNRYALLPVREREVHALTGIYRNDWTPQTHALFVGGVAYDRINGGVSPLVEGRVDQDIAENWQVGARARYAQETNNTDNQAVNLGADILYKF